MDNFLQIANIVSLVLLSLVPIVVSILIFLKMRKLKMIIKGLTKELGNSEKQMLFRGFDSKKILEVLDQLIEEKWVTRLKYNILPSNSSVLQQVDSSRYLNDDNLDTSSQMITFELLEEMSPLLRKGLSIIIDESKIDTFITRKVYVFGLSIITRRNKL